MDATRGSERVDETSDSLSLLGKTREEEEKEDKEKNRNVRERERRSERRGKVRKKKRTWGIWDIDWPCLLSGIHPDKRFERFESIQKRVRNREYCYNCFYFQRKDNQDNLFTPIRSTPGVSCSRIFSVVIFTQYTTIST